MKFSRISPSSYSPGEPEARTGTKLSPCVGQSPVVGVDAERLVLEADVVGPRQELGVGALHVVPLVERVHGDLPIGRQHGRQIGAQPQPVQMVRGQQRRAGDPSTRAAAARPDRGRPTRSHPSVRPAPSSTRFRAESGRTRPRRRRRRACRRGHSARRGTGNGCRRRGRSASVGQPGAAVQTGVVKGIDRLSSRPHDEDRLVSDHVLAVLPDVGDLLFAARHLPHPGPESFELQCGEIGLVYRAWGTASSSPIKTLSRSMAPLSSIPRHARNGQDRLPVQPCYGEPTPERQRHSTRASSRSVDATSPQVDLAFATPMSASLRVSIRCLVIRPKGERCTAPFRSGSDALTSAALPRRSPKCRCRADVGRASPQRGERVIALPCGSETGSGAIATSSPKRSVSPFSTAPGWTWSPAPCRRPVGQHPRLRLRALWRRFGRRRCGRAQLHATWRAPRPRHRHTRTYSSLSPSRDTRRSSMRPSRSSSCQGRSRLRPLHRRDDPPPQGEPSSRRSLSGVDRERHRGTGPVPGGRA